MTTILIIEKPGNIRELKVKVYAENELFKKAGFKSPEGFNIHSTWNASIEGNNYSINLYGKTTGKAGQENKYEFPPPADKKLFFGACVLTAKCNDTVCNLEVEIWEKIYENLFGGFEDLGDEDDDKRSEEDESNIKKTKSGYEKDGFVVDDEVDMEEENIEITKKNKNKKRKSSSVKKPAVQIDELDKMEVLDCTNELEEEEYI